MAAEFTAHCNYVDNTEDNYTDFVDKQIKRIIRNKMSDAFMANNVNPGDVDFIIYETCYTYRILNSKKIKKNENIIGINPEYFVSIMFDEKPKNYYNENENGHQLFPTLLDNFEHMERGSFVFKNDKNNNFYINFFKNLKFIIDLEFCTCNMESLFDITYKVIYIDGYGLKKVIYCCVNTEPNLK